VSTAAMERLPHVMVFGGTGSSTAVRDLGPSNERPATSVLLDALGLAPAPSAPVKAPQVRGTADRSAGGDPATSAGSR